MKCQWNGLSFPHPHDVLFLRLSVDKKEGQRKWLQVPGVSPCSFHAPVQLKWLHLPYWWLWSNNSPVWEQCSSVSGMAGSVTGFDFSLWGVRKWSASLYVLTWVLSLFAVVNSALSTLKSVFVFFSCLHPQKHFILCLNSSQAYHRMSSNSDTRTQAWLISSDLMQAWVKRLHPEQHKNTWTVCLLACSSWLLLCVILFRYQTWPWSLSFWCWNWSHGNQTQRALLHPAPRSGRELRVHVEADTRCQVQAVGLGGREGMAGKLSCRLLDSDKNLSFKLGKGAEMT